MHGYKGMLPKGFLVGGKYSVLLFIQRGGHAETYRAKSRDGKLYFLKLFDCARLDRRAFDPDGNLLEVELLKKVRHENIASYADSGELIVENKRYGYLVLDFIAGETLADRIARERFGSAYDIQRAVTDVLKGLDHLHSLPEPVVHNGITPQNIMLDLSGDVPMAKIIGFGHVRPFHQSSKTYDRTGLNLHYVASECFHGLYSPQSDVFSVGALMYQLFYGLPPWSKGVSNFQANRANAEKILLQERNRPLLFPEMPDGFIGFDENSNLVLKRALAGDVETRFRTANEFLWAVNGEAEVEDIDTVRKARWNDLPERKIEGKKAMGKGFSAIAGMQELKDRLQADVIDALHHPEEYAKYGVTIPNGMLLYGPPGCGKTFFAKHFAEEVGFHFLLATPATLKSRYVNATQENIANMFAEAEKNASTIIFIDEINELLPNRAGNVHEMSKSAVNEMLAQMDRTGEKRIFVIRATNYPDQIDPAMLRSGRLDRKIYLPPPDFGARKALFELYLKNRPLDFGIDHGRLAQRTENYVSADIEFLVNEASRAALKTKSRITMEILEETIKAAKPSVPLPELQKYEAIRKKMDGENPEWENNRLKIGF